MTPSLIFLLQHFCYLPHSQYFPLNIPRIYFLLFLWTFSKILKHFIFPWLIIIWSHVLNCWFIWPSYHSSFHFSSFIICFYYKLQSCDILIKIFGGNYIPAAINSFTDVAIPWRYFSFHFAFTISWNSLAWCLIFVDDFLNIQITLIIECFAILQLLNFQTRRPTSNNLI